MTSLRWDNVPKPRVERPPLLASSSKSTRRKQKPPNLKDRIEEVGGARTELQDLSRSANAAARTRLRLRALHVMGHGSARIARALGVREETVQRLVRGDARTISPPLRDAVTGLYDAWWDKRAPERTRAERAAAARARCRASAGNWCAGAALDDDQLDIPGYRPRTGYRPATGTGVATDTSPSARQHQRRR